jgi:hypothetical protein
VLNYVILCLFDLYQKYVYFEKEICTENHITCMLKFQRDSDMLYMFVRKKKMCFIEHSMCACLRTDHSIFHKSGSKIVFLLACVGFGV